MVSEGLAEVLHAAARGESITCLMLNNGVFGDTGGQMTAATTVGQRTKTDLGGPDRRRVRLPDPDVADIVASFPGVAYVARGAVDKPERGRRARAATCARRSRRSSRAKASRWSRSSPCARPAGRCPTDQGAQYQRDQMNPTFPIGELRPAVDVVAGRMTLDVRVHDILARAGDGRAPTASAPPWARSPDVRASSTPEPTGPRTASPPPASTAGRPRGTGGARPRSTTLEVGYGTSKLGAAIAPINPNFTEPEAAIGARGAPSARRRRAPGARRRRARRRRATGARRCS